MGSEQSLLGSDFKVMLGDDNSPPEYTDLCATFDFGSIGEEKPLVDVTSYCDDARAYRNGLADGVEIPLQMNYVPNDPQARALYEAYKTDSLVLIRIQQKGGEEDSPATEYAHFDFAATVRAWNVTGPIGDRAVLSFTLKVSGEVLWVSPEIES